MFTAFFDLIHHLPAGKVVLPIPEHVRQETRELTDKMRNVHEMLLEATDDWTRMYGEMTSLQKGIPIAPVAPKRQQDRILAGNENDSAERKGEDVDRPMIETHRHLFPCMISSLGTGCNMSKV